MSLLHAASGNDGSGCLLCLLSHESLPIPYPTCLSLHLLPRTPPPSFTSPQGLASCALCSSGPNFVLKIGYCFGSPEASLGFICVAILIAGMLGVERGALHALGSYCTTELCPLPRGLGIFVCFQRQSPAV